MIAGAGLTILLLALFGTSALSQISFRAIRPVELLLFAGSLFVLRKYKANPILIIFSTAVIGTALYMVF